jgi:ubiquinone biosynthesis protein
LAGDIASFGRLTGALWVLIRADALLPEPLDPYLPPSARVLAKAVRLLRGGKARRGRPGERLAGALETLGPAAIKLGQLLSTRADIFGEPFAEDLARLKDQLAPFPLDQAKAQVVKALGQPLEALFSAFGPAIAAASLAQAHPATLIDGRKVAVKVLRPGIEAQVRADIAALILAGRLAERLGATARRLEPRALTAAVARSLELELDLRLEAAGASELGEVMARDPYMRAPQVVWDGVAKRVLTLAWAEGEPLSSPAALEQEGLDRPALAVQLTRAFLAQALDHGVFHADLHEGNLFAAAPDKLMAVDFGILGRLGHAERRYLAEILWGFIERDYLRVAKVHFRAGYVPERHSVEAFAQAIRAVGEPIFGHHAGEVSMGRVLTQLFEITALFDMRLRPELVLLQKTMVTVEGVARRIDPAHDIWAAADPVVRRWIMRELSPASRLKRLADEGLDILETLVHRLETPPAPLPPAVEPSRRGSRAGWFALGMAVAGLAAAIAAVWGRT